MEKGGQSMDERDFNNRIKESLIKGTKESEELKEQVWTKIQNSIYDKKEEERMYMKSKGRNFVRNAAAIAAAFVVMVAVLSATTTTGQTAMKRIRDLLAPQKSITQEIEGDKEGGEFSLHTRDGEVDYAIYVDEERYTVEKGEEADRILPKFKADSRYPEVSMEIRQLKDEKPEELKKLALAELQSKYPTVRDMGQVEAPLRAYALYANNGQKSTDIVIKQYFVDNGKGGTIQITQKYFIEASEGHGVRFDNMLKELKIVDLSE